MFWAFVALAALAFAGDDDTSTTMVAPGSTCFPDFGISFPGCSTLQVIDADTLGTRAQAWAFERYGGLWAEDPKEVEARILLFLWDSCPMCDGITPDFVVMGAEKMDWATFRDMIILSFAEMQPEGEGMVPPVPEPVPPAAAQLDTAPAQAFAPSMQQALGEDGAELSNHIKAETSDSWWIVTTQTTEYVPAAQQHMTIATWRAWKAGNMGEPNGEGTAGSRLAAVAGAMAWIDSLFTMAGTVNE